MSSKQIEDERLTEAEIRLRAFRIAHLCKLSAEAPVGSVLADTLLFAVAFIARRISA